jgi:hypothetical protein
MFIKSPTGGGKGVMGKSGTRVNNGKFEELLMYTGGPCIHLGDQFQQVFDQCHLSSYNNDACVVEGGNATKFVNCYFSQVPAGCAGLRVWRMAAIDSCTGLDQGPIWAIFGGFPRWPTGSTTETARTGTTTTKVYLQLDNPFSLGFLVGFDLTSGSTSRRVTQHKSDGGGTYVTLSSALSGMASGQTYFFKDPWCPTATGRRPDIHMYGHCNLEIPTHCAIKMAHEASVLMDNGLFYTYEGNDFDCVIWSRPNRVASGYGIDIRGWTMYNEEGMEASRRLGQNLACEGDGPNYGLGLAKGVGSSYWDSRAGSSKSITRTI